MSGTRATFVVVLAVAAAAAALAVRPPGLDAQSEREGAREAAATTRFCVEVVRVVLPPGREVALPVPDPEKAVAAVVPVDPGARDGWVAAARLTRPLVETLRAGGDARVVMRGETEVRPGESGVVNTGSELPLESVQVRGSEEIRTTVFQKTGLTAKVRLFAPDDDLFDVTLEIRTPSGFARGPGDRPVLFSGTTDGQVMLPDGHTSIFSFTDRVSGELRGADGKPGEDEVVMFFVGLTRLDLARGTSSR